MVQTFLPYEDFEESLSCLDYRRLGKQRVETKQILDILEGRAKKDRHGNTPWGNHTVVRMWRGYAPLLRVYYNLNLALWAYRGYNNVKCVPLELDDPSEIEIPEWLGDDKLHSSHRAALLHKDQTYYSKFGWEESPVLNYYWPC